MGEPEIFGIWGGWEILEDEDMIRCSVCGKRVPEDQAMYCRRCGAILCKDCEVDGVCPGCANFEEQN
ncbi:MAG: hypothetical protein ACOC6H_02895 [Thermoproteota archaeon]